MGTANAKVNRDGEDSAGAAADRLREWYEHAESADFVFLRIPGGSKATHATGWTGYAVAVRGKVVTATAAMKLLGAGHNVGVGIEKAGTEADGSPAGGRGIILDADDDDAIAAVDARLKAAGVVTLSANTPRGVAWYFTLPDGVTLPKLNESMVSGLGLLGTRPAGHYQVGPGSQVGPGAYGQNKTPPDESGGPWFYTVRDVEPVAELPTSLGDAIVQARAKAEGESLPLQAAPAKAKAAAAGPSPKGGQSGDESPRTGGEGKAGGGPEPRRRSGRRALGCRSVDLGIATLRHLVQAEGRGRNDSLYRVACSLVWHRALKTDNRAEVEARLIPVQAELRSGESRPVHVEVPEQVGKALAFIARQGGPGADDPGKDEPVPPPPDDLAGDVERWKEWKDEAAEWKPKNPRAMREAAPELLRQFRGRVHPDRGTDAGVFAELDAIAAAFDDGGDESARQVIVESMPEPVRAVAVPAVEGDAPAALLRLRDRDGSALSVGTVGVLSGAGGLGKSALTAGLALELASRPAGEAGKLPGGVFDAPIGGGPVVLVQWEDEPTVTRDRIRAAAKALSLSGAEGNVYLVGMREPIFGRPAGAVGNTPPEYLPAWGELWGEVKRIGPRLVVLDPAMAAFADNPNDVGAVRAFVTRAVGQAAREHECAVLVVAHSTKAGRKDEADWFDPGHIAGSAAWTDGVRSVMTLRRDDEGGVCLVVVKANYGPARLAMNLEAVRGMVRDKDGHERESGPIVAFRAGRLAGWSDPPGNGEGTGSGGKRGGSKPPLTDEESLTAAVKLASGVQNPKNGKDVSPAWKQAGVELWTEAEKKRVPRKSIEESINRTGGGAAKVLADYGVANPALDDEDLD